MNNAWNNFRERREEVKQYVRFVYDLINKEEIYNCSNVIEGHSTNKSRPFDIRIHKATVILLLYNLVESTTTSAIIAIYSKIKEEEICYDDCSDKIKRTVLNNCRKHFNRQSWDVEQELEFVKKHNLSIAQYLIYHKFNTNNILPGNVGLMELIKLSKKYGFNNPAIGENFGLFSSIKEMRNDLAHGNKTFAEVGQNIAKDDIIKYYVQTIRLMRNTLKSIEKFLENKEYLSEVENECSVTNA